MVSSIRALIALFLFVSVAAHSAEQTSTPPPVRSDAQAERLADGSIAVVPLVVGQNISPEVAVSSPTDAATAANFDYLSWRSDGYYNEYYRYKAAREASKGEWAHAALLFEIAARYGDKYSQHRLSLLHWHGVGVAKNRIGAYVWADLAAERGYPTLLAIREKMWEALTDEEREAVPKRGKRMYAKYGDKAALSLFRGMLARQRARHFLLIRSTVPSKLPRYYEDSYLAQEARSWKKIRVDVGEIQTDAATPPGAAPSSPQSKTETPVKRDAEPDLPKTPSN
jgi:TPR repeat protein